MHLERTNKEPMQTIDNYIEVSLLRGGPSGQVGIFPVLKCVEQIVEQCKCPGP